MTIKTIACLVVLLLISKTLLAQDAADSTPPAQPADATGDTVDCAALARAHASLLQGCFRARRHFSATLNKKPVRREWVQLDYAAGKLDVDLLEEEIFDNRIKMDGAGDMAVESSFSCGRLTRNAEGRYELESAEDPERIVFDYDESNSVLLPFRWEFEQKTRFLFKKFHIKAHADYSDVSYNACRTEPGTSEEH